MPLIVGQAAAQSWLLTSSVLRPDPKNPNEFELRLNVDPAPATRMRDPLFTVSLLVLLSSNKLPVTVAIAPGPARLNKFPFTISVLAWRTTGGRAKVAMAPAPMLTRCALVVRLPPFKKARLPMMVAEAPPPTRLSRLPPFRESTGLFVP